MHLPVTSDITFFRASYLTKSKLGYGTVFGNLVSKSKQVRIRQEYYLIALVGFTAFTLEFSRVGRAQLYRLSLVDAHTVAQNQYIGK